jgi:hypothetical protein
MFNFPMMSPPYNPADWYWLVGDNSNEVWSSASASFVAVNAPKFVAWSQGGYRKPTRISSLDMLRDVLLEQYPDGAPKAV